MQLLSATLQGFKSFEKRINVTFKPGVTGIIGPNGSGKSNIAEAIRWVLGEQSSKALRAKERTDVIYIGEKGKSSRATVTLTFDNTSGRFPLKASEIAVTRSLTLQGESEYLVNNEPIRLIDLQQMLAEAGIGTKSYTVISQGTVDRYLTATPQGRRELFDEATGIKSLQIKLGLSRQKCEKTKLHAEEVRAILEELLPRVTFLKRQVDRYEKREQYETAFRTKQQLWYHHAWQNASKELERLAAEQNTLASRIQDARTKRTHMEKETMETLHSAQKQENSAFAHATWKKEHDTLTTLLTKTSQDKKKVEELLVQQEPTNTSRNDWPTTALIVLRDCQQYFASLIAGETLDIARLKNLQSSVQNILSGTNTDKPHIAPSLLQDVTRLTAIEQEQKRQLEYLTEPAKPTVLSNQALSETSSREVATRNLERLRSEEIQLEREDSAIASALQQLRSDLSILEQEILRECGTATLTRITTSLPEEKEVPTDQELRTLSQKIASIGEKDPLVIKEYEEARIRFDSLQSQLSDIEATMQDIEEWITQVTAQMKENFQEQFARIQQSFSEYFIQLFGGGKAELASSEEGVDIIVAPPKKRPRHIALLSGGERTLTSLALIFAILDVQKPPFIVLDEVDAALDEANSKRFASLLNTLSHITQSIVISHNRETMSVADILYGVTMHIDGTSHLYSVSIEDIAPIPQETVQMQV